MPPLGTSVEPSAFAAGVRRKVAKNRSRKGKQTDLWPMCHGSVAKLPSGRVKTGLPGGRTRVALEMADGDADTDAVGDADIRRRTTSRHNAVAPAIRADTADGPSARRDRARGAACLFFSNISAHAGGERRRPVVDLKAA